MRYISGFHAVEETLRKGVQGSRLLVAGKGPRIKAILDFAKAAGHPVENAAQTELDRLCPDNRGLVLGLPDSEGSPDQVDLVRFLDGRGKEPSLVLVLDHLSDPHNFGAVIRSADQFGADLVVIPSRRSVKETETVARSSAGASAWVPVAVVPNLSRALESLKASGYWAYAADMGGKTAYSLDLKGKVALVMGGEGLGVGKLLSGLCDERIGLPCLGKVDSLNVSVAAGVLMYEYRRQNPQA
jgi:23S rRNA (guanosine2251-2'-O)-methyltransferase